MDINLNYALGLYIVAEMLEGINVKYFIFTPINRINRVSCFIQCQK